MKEKLFYVVGPSGAGKDTLLSYAREHLAGQHVAFAHRYITRPATSPGENHVALSNDEFLLRERSGLFAMHWSSHGLKYGVGIEIDSWLECGVSVVVNGSRAYLPSAAHRYPDLILVQIDARPDVLALRLTSRGRETTEQIRQRLERRVPLKVPAHIRSIEVDNSSTIDEAGSLLLRFLNQSSFVS
jgi:ribose 1,5-bisphosphokinase